VGGEQAAKGGLALFRGQRSGRIIYVLYDPKALAEESKQPGFYSMRFSRPLDQIVVAFIKAMPHSGDCNDAMEVKMSAASKGYGPLMYDIVMSDGDGGLMPDRVSTSGQAKKLWQFYGSKRGDVKKVPFDNADDPKTPQEDDDCAFVDDKDDVLNYSYDGPGQASAKSQLMQRHEDVVAQFEEAGGMKRQSLEGLLMNLGDTLFDTKYGK
jgi:hypothetical protein